MNNTDTAKQVIVIPATKSLHPERDGVVPNRKKKRVAAYCRVSTTLEEQQGSYALQKQYYENFINSRADWELVGIYGDEGKSGTSLKGRTGFLNMMDDVRAGKIDCIITKATSRFGRNNAEFIRILDELEHYGVEVSFESEGIMTSGQQNRTMLQVMGATNEHYSNTLSNNVRWSKERNMREGKVTFCYKTFLGYEKGEDGNPQIVPEEAELVRLIFELFIAGQSYASVARELNARGYTTKTGKEWKKAAVRRVLSNEKYTGDALLQKTYKKSYLDKSCTINNGEKSQYLVRNNHPAIIDRDTFAKVKELMGKREKNKTYGTAKSPFNGKIICSECGAYFSHKTWNSRGNIQYAMWTCGNKYTEETTYSDKKCKTPNLRQEWLEQGYLYTINQILARKTEYLGKCERKLVKLSRRLEPKNIDQEIKDKTKALKAVDDRLAELSREWEFTFGRNAEFLSRQAELKAEAEQIIAERRILEEERDNLRARKAELERFIVAIEKMPDKVERFSAEKFTNTIDHIAVGKNSLLYHFYGDVKVRVSLDDLREVTR